MVSAENLEYAEVYKRKKIPETKNSHNLTAQK
jgi:hypothetical protein